MKKGVAVVVMVIGMVLIVLGATTQIPATKLTTYDGLNEKEYSVIREYVGGDAYNYIIGASLVGAEIAGAKTQKAVFMAVGILIVCIGLCFLAYASECDSGRSSYYDDDDDDDDDDDEYYYRR